MASHYDKKRNKLKLSNFCNGKGWRNGYVKPSGKFWKRRYNKRVRKGKTHKRDNYFYWC